MSRETATLLDVLIDGFEKNEVMGGFHDRSLPMPDEASAIDRFEVFAREALAWKGPPIEEQREGPRRLVRYADLEIRQVGRGIVVRVRAPRFHTWWHAADTWPGTVGPVHEWIAEESA